jgi:DNA-binding SARP family transcriptional activator/tetratricopeptide (TPR) repeat protein
MLYVSLLGEQDITEDGTSVQALSSRAVALVAFLAVHAGAPQPRQRIAGTFWPESTGGQALTNLRRELHHLRQILGKERSLVVTSRDLCWRDTDTCRVDLRVFSRAREAALAAGDDPTVLAHAATAVACYKGDLLPGAYDEWLSETRAELDRQCADLCDLLRAARARTGDLPGAAQAARRRIQLQPLEEIGYRTLMLLQADLGDRAGAVSTYHHCASVLERELGVIPDPATRQAFQHLIASGALAGPSPNAVPSSPRSGVATAQLVGRSHELASLTELWRNAASGTPGLVLIRGGAGVGKSRIAAELAAMAGLHGAVVAGSQCFGTSGRLALAPVADWLRHPAMLAASTTLEPAWRVEVGRLLPVAGREERGAGTRAMADSWQRHRFFEGLARALMAVERPTLLVLDNIQWCDQETLSFITFFLGLAAGHPVLVAGTWRDDSFDDDPDLATWTVRMRASGRLTELPLSPLDASGTARLAEAMSGRPLPQPDADLLQATTGGFPLYIVEAMRGRDDADGALPPAGDLAAVLRTRLQQASAPAREVAGLAAAVGEDFSLDLLTEASDLDAGTVVGAVDELWQRRIMREYRDGYDFSHDLLRDTAYRLVSPPRRWLLHRRVAQALELLHPGDADAVSAQLAGQYARGGQLARAVTYYRRAADVAAGRFAHAEAIRLHTEALTIVRSLPEGRDRDRQELGVLEAIAAPLNARYGYSSPRLQQALERSVALAEALGRRDATLTGLVGLWMTQFVQGRAIEGYQTARRALALADPVTEPSGPAHFAVGGSALTLGRPAEALRHLELAVRLTNGSPSLPTGTRADVHGEAFAAHAHWLLGQDDEARASCRGALSVARTAGHPYSLAVALAYACITHQIRDDRPALRGAVTELRELCERYGFAYYRDWGMILDGWSQPGASGIDLARAGIRNLKSAGSFARMPYWLSLLADLWARDGKRDASVATLDAALAAGRAYDDLWWLPEVTRARAAHDDTADAAAARLAGAARLASDHGSVALLRRCERDLATSPPVGVPPVRPSVPAAANAARTVPDLGS